MNTNWFTTNAGRRYPLEDQSSGVSSSGSVLPTWFLLDAAITWPDGYDVRRVFVMTAEATAAGASITVGAEIGETNTGFSLAYTSQPFFTPYFGSSGAGDQIRAVLSGSSSTTDQVVDLVPIDHGFSGHVVFGGYSADSGGSWIFPGTDGASDFSPRAAYPILRVQGVTAISGVNLDPVSGDVSLVASSAGGLTITAVPAGASDIVLPDGRTIGAVMIGMTPGGTSPLSLLRAQKNQSPVDGTCRSKTMATICGVAPDPLTGKVNLVIREHLTPSDSNPIWATPSFYVAYRQGLIEFVATPGMGYSDLCEARNHPKGPTVNPDCFPPGTVFTL